MATAISWADESWNPIVGCTPVSVGCAHCYAARTALRLDRCGLPQYQDLAQRDLLGRPMWSGAVRYLPDALQIPYRWTRPRHVFLGSMSDVFHEQIPDAFRDRIWDVMEDTDHCYLVLTKRPTRMRDYLLARRHRTGRSPAPHIFLGTTIESSAHVGRLRALVHCYGPKWLSLEPLLDDLVDALAEEAMAVFGPRLSSGGADIAGFVDWIVAGGETGPGAKPVEAEWMRVIRDLCRNLDIPFHLKQWGVAAPGRTLDGRTHDDRPALDATWWSGPDMPCRTCGAPGYRHHRCRGCLARHRSVLEMAS